MVSYISLGIAVISLLLGIYNWYQSIVRLRIDAKIYNTVDDYWAVETVISNLAARPVTILDTRLIPPKNQTFVEAELRRARDFYVFMHDGRNVGTATFRTEYPLMLGAYGADTVLRIVNQKPAPNTKFEIKTPTRRFRFKIRVSK